MAARARSVLLETGRLRAILRHFPRSLLVSQRQSWRVVDLRGDVPQDIILSTELRRRAARAISKIEEEEARRYAELKKSLEEVRRRLEPRIGSRLTVRGQFVSESQISLTLPDEAETELYPRVAQCSNCGTFVNLDRLLKSRGHSPSCPVCGGGLLQVGIVFVCKKCSNVVELKPARGVGKPRPEGVFACRECGAPLTLELVREDLGKSKWICNKCGKKAGVYMKCERCGELMTMKQTTQDFLYARHVSVLLVGGQLFEDMLSEGVKSLPALFKLSDVVKDEQEKTALREVFAVEDAVLIPEVTSAIGVYGYSVERDGPVITFRKTERGRVVYKVYCSESRGMAALFRFDEDKIRSVAKDDEDEFTLLHSIAHALVKQSALEAGVEEGTFLAKVFERDYAVLLYEARGAEEGGLEYVFKYRLPSLFVNARRMLSQCRYQCDSACFDCLFINNALCHPTADYITPNSYLNRKLTLKLWEL